MPKAKGQLSRARLNADYPHQVILPCSRTVGEAANKAHGEFIKAVAGSRQGHNVYQGDEWHHVFCFREAEHATEFQRKYGGQPFDHRLLGGSNWASLKEQPKSQSKLERWPKYSARTKRL
jgi:hypothetical protein